MRVAGRRESLRLLADAAKRARSGQGGLVMVRADPGMGVTALLEAHRLAMRDAGMRTYRVPVLPPRGSTTLSHGKPPEWEEPAVVVMDDLHHADDATLLALHGLAGHLPERKLLLVTGRRRGVTPSRFAALDRLSIVHDLPPLDDEAVRTIVAGIADTADGEAKESLQGLAADAAGNPWLLTRLVAPERAAEVTAWATELAGADSVLLRYAAILDEPASVAELATVTGWKPAEVIGGIERLAAHGLAEQAGGLLRLRSVLLRNDLAVTSAGLRRSVACTLADAGAAAETVAGHLVHAEADSWTVAWLAEHAEKLAIRATPELVDLLARSVAALRPGDPHRNPLRTAWAEALLWTGKLDEARRVATAGLHAQPDAAVRNRLQAVRALAALGEMDPEAAVASLGSHRADGELSPRLAAIDALARLLSGDLAGAESAMEHALSTGGGDPLVEVYSLHARTVVRTLTRDLTGALELLDASYELLDNVVYEPGQWLTSRLLRAVVQGLRFDRASLETIEQARPVAREMGAGLLAWLHTIAALAYFNNGDYDRVLAEISDAMAMPDQYGMAAPLHSMASMVLYQRGDLPAARLHAELADQAVSRGAALFYEQITVITRARLADADGNTQQALDIVRAIADGAVGVHHGHAVAATAGQLVRIAVTGGDRELALRITELAREWTSGDSAGEGGTLSYCEALANSDVDGLLAAAKEFTETGMPITAARAAEEAARVLAESGKSEEAKLTYQTAIDRYTTVAAVREISRADAAMRAHGLRRGAAGPRRRAKRGWDSLTATELRVVELVAQGLTNREVADRLVVSVRTVDSHVSRVLGKLGCSSRVELAVKYRERA